MFLDRKGGKSQFHYGSIQMLVPLLATACIITSQFHYGSIQISAVDLSNEIVNCLNSTMVRFKLQRRSKHARNIGRSQFHYGSIQMRLCHYSNCDQLRLNSTMVRFKSTYNTEYIRRDVVSIPLWFDSNIITESAYIRVGKCLNSTMVRFKFLKNCFIYELVYAVSIPLWFDSNLAMQ